MRVFTPGWLSSRMNSSRYVVIFLLLFTRFRPGMTSSRDDFIPVSNTRMKYHPGKKRAEKCRLNGLPGIKVPCVKSVREDMGEMNSTPAGRLPG